MSALLQDFLNAAPVTIDHAEALARAMAARTRLLRDAMVCGLAQDKGAGPLHDLWQVYRQALITNLSAKDFADLQAQTTTYGLFAARCGHPAGAPFTRQSAIFSTTTPFLQAIFNHITAPGLDKRMAWIIDGLAVFWIKSIWWQYWKTLGNAASGKIQWDIFMKLS